MIGQPRAHELTHAQFAEIAAGAGGPATLSALSDAQVSKRLLLLWAIRSGKHLPGAEDSWALLDRALEESREGAHRALSRPFVDSWATGVLLSGGPGPSAHGYLIGLAVASALAARVPFALTLPADFTELFIPGAGRLRPRAPGEVRLRHADGHLIVSVDGNDFLLGPGPDDRVSWEPCLVLPELGLEIDDLDPFRASLGLPSPERSDHHGYETLARLLRRSRDVVERDHSRFAATVRTCLSTVVPVNPTALGSVSASSRQAFGAVAVSVPSTAEDLALALIHETQHVKLGALLDLVDLIRPGSTGLFHAPWRTDPRPAGQLLQGVYAHAAVAEFWSVERTRTDGARRITADYEFTYWLQQSRMAAGTLARSGYLTELGQTFVGIMSARLDELHAPVDPDVARSVAVTTTVNSVIWRLRRNVVDPALVAELVTAFRRSRPCPPLPSPAVEAAAPGPAEAANSLVQHVKGDAGRGLMTDWPADAEELVRRAGAGPLNEEAWARLAVAVPAVRPEAAPAVGERPELLSAMLEHMAPDRPDVLDLATWLSPACLPATAT